jgi:glycine/D-amino acid oxidase-like deaminating enzyme
MAVPNINTFSPNHSVSRRPTPFHPLDTKKVTVIGAGAFGGWIAFNLLRRGYDVTLVDAWGAGNSRSSSGDETRVIRSTYGGNELYFQLNVRALELWKEHETAFNRKIFFNTGVLWLCYRDENPIVDDSIPFSKKYQSEYDCLTVKDLQTRYPEINPSDLSHLIFFFQKVEPLFRRKQNPEHPIKEN